MAKLIICVLCLLVLSKALPTPEIQVYEIHKNVDRNFAVDDQYFDPDGLREDDTLDTHIGNNNLAVKLLYLLNALTHNTHSMVYEHDDGHSRDHEHEEHGISDPGDLTRSLAVVIVPMNSKPHTALGKLLRSPLRSQYEVEDRTAPPRIRRPYDDY
ncbi:uncharacterized protein LOC123695743 [Colias croceus]|uniref:uncharacterized protein LOC123695743 n=1 Tax=Colias crocea TaxID=72248 RepID=UPI001E2812E4|nr:uncharacterized protein LOC123695743 [Colias croceus]